MELRELAYFDRKPHECPECGSYTDYVERQGYECMDCGKSSKTGYILPKTVIFIQQ